MKLIVGEIPLNNSSEEGMSGPSPSRGGVKLREIPRNWPVSTIQELDYFSNTKARAVSQAQRRPIKAGNMPALEETVYEELPDHSNVTKWMPRGFATVPTTSAPVEVLFERVPDGHNYWLESASFYLFPDTHNLDFHWEILVNGIDILNYGNNNRYPGLPLQFGNQINFGSTRDQQIMVRPGSLIRVLIIAIAPPLAWTDIATATLMGSLVGRR